MKIPERFTIEISMTKLNGDIKVFLHKEINHDKLLSTLKHSMDVHPHFNERMVVTLSLKNNDFYRGKATDLMKLLKENKDPA